MKAIVFFTLFMAISVLCFAGQTSTDCRPWNNQDLTEQTNRGQLYTRNYQPTEQRRGCCSHHGGVCGCQGGRALCCDGTLSPSCGCD